MKKYTILAIDLEGLIYELDETDGKYKRNSISEILDFFLSGRVKIIRIRRESDGLVINVGDELDSIYKIFGIRLGLNPYILPYTGNKIPLEEVKMMKKKTLKEIEDQILQERPVRIQGILKKRTESISDFLQKFFEELNAEKETIYVDTRETQTEPNKRRSLGDIYLILKYYYPNTNLKEVVSLLQNDMPSRISGFRTSYCGQTKKRMFYYDPTKSTDAFDLLTRDEYGNKYEEYLR